MLYYARGNECCLPIINLISYIHACILWPLLMHWTENVRVCRRVYVCMRARARGNKYYAKIRKTSSLYNNFVLLFFYGCCRNFHFVLFHVSIRRPDDLEALSIFYVYTFNMAGADFCSLIFFFSSGVLKCKRCKFRWMVVMFEACEVPPVLSTD